MKQSALNRYTRNVLLVAIAFFAVLLQVATMFFVLDEPHKLSWPDPNHYYRIAKVLSEGGPYSVAGDAGNIYRSPGYPFLLSMVIRLVGENIILIRLFHIALYPIFLLVLYKLGTVFIDQKVGLLAAALGALYPIYLYIPMTIYPESLLIYLFAFIALMLFYAGDNLNYSRLFLLGGTISLAIMIRPTSIVWIPTCLFYLLRTKKHKIRYHLKICLAVVVVPMLFITSWMVRNYRVHGAFVFSTAGSINLLRGYNKDATWKHNSEPVPPTRELEDKLLKVEPLSKREQLRMAEVKKFIINNPLRALKIAFLRCVDLWNPIPSTTTKGGMAQLKFKIINALAYLPLLILGVRGFAINWNSMFTKALFVLIILNTVVNGLIAVSVRYRTVTDFGIILMAASALSAVATRYQTYKTNKLTFFSC